MPKIYNELPKMLRAFFVGNILMGGLLVVSHCLVLFLLGSKSWLALGVGSGLLNILPLVGAPLSILFPILAAAQELGSLDTILVIACAFTAAHFFASNVVLPAIVGSRININTAALVIGLLFWGWFWGAIGFLLAIPMTAAVKILLEANRETVALANLMAVRPRLFVGAFKPRVPAVKKPAVAAVQAEERFDHADRPAETAGGPAIRDS
ncbi:MAG: AI-2E family transporter [Proteobacteria bacterium]|nr:MAG: AI-2E family transporter [Pseudomonadota bacterium]